MFMTLKLQQIQANMSQNRIYLITLMGLNPELTFERKGAM